MKIREPRKKNNFTQQNVANILNITHQSYNNYENGKFEPNIETLKKLSKLFNTSIDNLVDNNPNISLSPIQNELIDEIVHISDENCMKLKAYLDGLRNK